MNSFIRDLHEDRAGFVKEFTRQEQPVAQVAQVGVQAQFPGVAEGFDHFRFGGQVFILAVLHVALVDERLEVRAVFYAVGRVEINHLHLPGHALFFQQRIHHQQTVARDEAVAPVVRVLVKLNRLAQRRVFGL